MLAVADGITYAAPRKTMTSPVSTTSLVAVSCSCSTYRPVFSTMNNASS